MIRFVDVRYQGLQARFSFWTTVQDMYIAINDEQAWETWNDFLVAYVCDSSKVLQTYGPDILARLFRLCPPWVFTEPTDEELDFKDEEYGNKEQVDQANDAPR